MARDSVIHLWIQNTHTKIFGPNCRVKSVTRIAVEMLECIPSKHSQNSRFTICIRKLTGETKGKYQIQRKGVYEPYVLTIFNLQKSDGRRYYCCVASKSPSGVSVNDDCQVFNVEVHDER